MAASQRCSQSFALFAAALRHNTLHPRRLQLPHLLLERRHLAVAVQRPPVVLPQTPNHLAARCLHRLGKGAGHLALPLLKTRAQTGNLFADRCRCCRVAGGGGGGLVIDGLFQTLELGQLFGLQAAQLVGDAGLDVKLKSLGAGDVGLCC